MKFRENGKSNPKRMLLKCKNDEQNVFRYQCAWSPSHGINLWEFRLNLAKITTILTWPIRSQYSAFLTEIFDHSRKNKKRAKSLFCSKNRNDSWSSHLIVPVGSISAFSTHCLCHISHTHTLIWLILQFPSARLIHTLVTYVWQQKY